MRHALPKILLLLTVVLLAGCGDRIQVEIPPKAPVEGIRHVVILPFDNVSNDASLGYEIEERIASSLRSSGWYSSVQTLRHSVTFPAGQPVTFESVRQLEDVAKADAVILGTATYYFEDVYMSTPYCSGCDRPEANPSWTVSQQTDVAVRFTGRMIEVATGRELYSMTSTGEDLDHYTHFLSHRGYTAPPESLIPRDRKSVV